MKKIKRYRLCAFFEWLVLVLFAGQIILSCSLFHKFDAAKTQLSVMCYNTQTFFDAVQNGKEFPEFKSSKSAWNEKKYQTRLERLKDTVLQLGSYLNGMERTVPDILVLQEIENTAVVEDFCKQLPVHQSYPYVVCTPTVGRTPFSIVLLSRYPIVHFVIHFLDIPENISTRPMIEAVINRGNAEQESLITVFAVHWKSKAGKKKYSTVRVAQEQQLMQKITAHCMSRPKVPYIVCGDFNQTLEECTLMHNMSVCWKNSDYENAVTLGKQPLGSYCFRKQWERIDHIFYEDNSSVFTLRNFHVLYELPLIENGMPRRYNVWSGTGYSDHLPLGAVFSFEKSSG